MPWRNITEHLIKHFGLVFSIEFDAQSVMLGESIIQTVASSFQGGQVLGLVLVKPFIFIF